MRRLAVVLASVVTAGALSSCGGGPALSAKAATELEGQVQAVRTAAVGHDRAGAAADLAQLRQQVMQLEQQRQISATKAKAILDAVSAVQAQLTSIPLPPPPPTTVPPTTSTSAPAPAPARPSHHQDGGGGDSGGRHGGGHGGD